MQKTSIEYADYVTNPLRAYDRDTGRCGHACVKYNTGCANCWAEQLNQRFGTHLHYCPNNLNQVCLYLDQTELNRFEHYRPRGPFKFGAEPWAFFCDMTDWMLPEYGDDAGRVLWSSCTRFDINSMFLTKRWEQLPRLLDWCAPCANVYIGLTLPGPDFPVGALDNLFRLWAVGWHVWISHEPALGPLNLPYDASYLSLLVSGGESGSRARPSETDWHRQDRDWCLRNSVPYFFKQWGERLPAGQIPDKLDGVSWRQMPGNTEPVGTPVAINFPVFSE